MSRSPLGHRDKDDLGGILAVGDDVPKLEWSTIMRFADAITCCRGGL
jgi:hypothetical protein